MTCVTNVDAWQLLIYWGLVIPTLNHQNDPLAPDQFQLHAEKMRRSEQNKSTPTNVQTWGWKRKRLKKGLQLATGWQNTHF